jgi:hypothetical protein
MPEAGRGQPAQVRFDPKEGSDPGCDKRIQSQSRTCIPPKPAPNTRGIHPPIHLKAIRWQPGIQNHRASRHTLSGGRCLQTAPSFGNVEASVAAKQWVIRPGNMIKCPLPAHHFAIGARFQGKNPGQKSRYAGWTPSICEQCFQAWAIWQHFQARKNQKAKAHQFFSPSKSAQYQDHHCGLP